MPQHRILNFYPVHIYRGLFFSYPSYIFRFYQMCALIRGLQNGIKPSCATLHCLPGWPCFDSNIRFHWPGSLLCNKTWCWTTWFVLLSYILSLITVHLFHVYEFDVCASAGAPAKFQKQVYLVQIASNGDGWPWLNDPIAMGTQLNQPHQPLLPRRLHDPGVIVSSRKRTRRLDVLNIWLKGLQWTNAAGQGCSRLTQTQH